jgi:hypothetical protein
MLIPSFRGFVQKTPTSSYVLVQDVSIPSFRGFVQKTPIGAPAPLLGHL